MHPNDGRVASNFIVQALKGEPITIYGDGSQTRSLCYVDDLIEGIVRLMNSPKDVTGPIDLGNPGEFTMRQLVELAINLTGAKSRLSFQGLPQDDPKQRQPDITLAKEHLGWRPTAPLKEGLRRTIAYFDKLLSGRQDAPASVRPLHAGGRPARVAACGASGRTLRRTSPTCAVFSFDREVVARRGSTSASAIARRRDQAQAKPPKLDRSGGSRLRAHEGVTQKTVKRSAARRSTARIGMASIGPSPSAFASVASFSAPSI